MTYDGPAFYDDDTIFNTYMTSRRRSNNPNDTIEKPVILELAGELTGQRILDLGCGDAALGREALTQGCQIYLGIEGSRNMVEAAQQNLAGTTGKVEHTTVEAWDYPAETFELVVSRLVLHYIEDVETVFKKIYHTLVPGGRFVFSVEHPVMTSCDRGWQGNGPRQDWIVDNYFNTGRRLTSWLGGQVVKYHRTVENYFAGLQRTGFVVESVREAEPQRERFKDDNTYQRRQRIPLFLIMAGKKIASQECA
ncbi:class I SAM-dependent methyltransferase [Candidatus Entotheonella palauensis]|uniref:class I SAM-dependent methyltransferase n=1 Tax=Candidatus Entotheonella palauensis TaxID=93172 RepID=UPI000B7FC8C1|nr:class I SAM-dependent methyltransferase [Candidatus Entotheonella palauensis]